MKRILTIILLLVMTFTLCACGTSLNEGKNEIVNSSVSTKQETESDNKSKNEIIITNAVAKQESGSEKANNSNLAFVKPSGVEWKEVKYTTTDRDGYKFEVTYKISPWILLSNSDTVNAVWAEVGTVNKIPSFDDWGLNYQHNSMTKNLSKSTGGYTTFECQSMNDMYYCMGSIRIKNVTEGWSLSADNKRSVQTAMTWSNERKDGLEGAQVISRVYFSNGNEVKETGQGILFSASMPSNEWGPVPFIIMAPEAFTPNYPNGRFYAHFYSGHFAIGDSSIGLKDSVFLNDNYLGIIGKDGQYLPPKNIAQLAVKPGSELTLKKMEGNHYILVAAETGDKKLSWDADADSWYDNDTKCWIWNREGTWQYWYNGISSDYGDFGWMEHDSKGWYIEESNGNWILVPDTYNVTNLWYID